MATFLRPALLRSEVMRIAQTKTEPMIVKEASASWLVSFCFASDFGSVMAKLLITL
jgi:hypothetical protein